MTISKTKVSTYSLMTEIIDEALQGYKVATANAGENDSVDEAVNEGFRKALEELRKISF